MQTPVWDAVIVGGGHNGLVAAAYLARAGLQVLLLERRPVLGGAAVTEEIFPGFQVSTAAYLCGLFSERIVRDLSLTRFGYRVDAKDPVFFTPFPDGRHLTLWQDVDRSCHEIARFSRRDARAYPGYLAFIEALARQMERLWAESPPDLLWPQLADLWKLGKLGWALAKCGPQERIGLARLLTQSVSEFLDPWFESEALKVTLATDGVIGAAGGPRSAGTAYMLLHHVMGKVDGRRGLWGFVRGGMGALSLAIASAARRAGAVLRTGAEVELILVKGGRARGVVLSTGEAILARSVVSNADSKRTFLRLLEKNAIDPDFRRQVERLRMEGSAMKINLTLDGLPSFQALPGSQLMPHHRATIHICPNLDYLERAWDEAKFGRPSRRPFLEITIPTTYDASLAPPGKHIMNIFLQYAPYRLSEGSWPDLKEWYADQVMELLEEYAPGFQKRVLHRQVLSPLDLEEVFGLTGGSIFHGEMSLDQLFALRPLPGWAAYRTPVPSLYLCGAGTHPGGGVTGRPGHNAARQLLRDRRAGRT